MGNTGNNSNYRDAVYSLYMSAFNNKLMENIFNGVPAAEGIDKFLIRMVKMKNLPNKKKVS